MGFCDSCGVVITEHLRCDSRHRHFAFIPRLDEELKGPESRFFVRNPKAGAAGALVLGNSEPQCVGAIAADEPPVLMGSHRSALDADQTVWAADD